MQHIYPEREGMKMDVEMMEQQERGIFTPLPRQEKRALEIRIIDLHWITGSEDDPSDLCLHGNVFLRIGNEIIEDEADYKKTVSLSAYRMLESLYSDHIHGDNGQLLLPCCGSFMGVDKETDEPIIVGCPNGRDWSVTHLGQTVTLTTAEGTQVCMPSEEYREIVFEFVDAVKSFYDECSPKIIIDDYENEGYRKFWDNWEARRNNEL